VCVFIGFGVGVVGRVFGGCILGCGYSLVVVCGGDRGEKRYKRIQWGLASWKYEKWVEKMCK